MRKFTLIRLAPVLGLIVLMCWALASPIGSSPDDDYHLASIWCANSANTSACKPGGTPAERMVPPLVNHIACYAQQTTQTAACQNQYLKLGSDPTQMTGRGSFSNNYPPVYYAVMSVFVGPDIIGSALLMRLVNILIMIGLTTALFLLLPRNRRPVLVWGWLISTVPLGLFLLASDNPSAWALIGIGSAWIALLGYFETTGRRKAGLGILFAVSAVVAAGSRADSALYLVLSVGVVLILTFKRTRRYLVSAALPLIFCILGFYFFFSSQQSSVIVNGLGDGTTPSTGSSFALLGKVLMNIPALWNGALGGYELGWLDTTMPAAVTFGAVVAFVAVAVIGFSQLTVRKGVALGLVASALWLIPTYVLVKGMNLVGENVQPRYLLPLMLLFAGLAMVGVRRRSFKLLGAQLVLVMVLLALAQSLALYTTMRRYLTGVDGSSWNLDANVNWWWSNVPFSPMFVWGLGSLAYAALVIILVREITTTRRLTISPRQLPVAPFESTVTAKPSAFDRVDARQVRSVDA